MIGNVHTKKCPKIVKAPNVVTSANLTNVLTPIKVTDSSQIKSQQTCADPDGVLGFAHPLEFCKKKWLSKYFK